MKARLQINGGLEYVGYLGVRKCDVNECYTWQFDDESAADTICLATNKWLPTSELAIADATAHGITIEIE